MGLGALFPQWFGRMAGVITVVGLSLHAFGMWDKHRSEGRDQAENSLWVVVLYWVCWLLLAGVLGMLLFWRPDSRWYAWACTGITSYRRRRYDLPLVCQTV